MSLRSYHNFEDAVSDLYEFSSVSKFSAKAKELYDLLSEEVKKDIKAYMKKENRTHKDKKFINTEKGAVALRKLHEELEDERQLSDLNASNIEPNQGGGARRKSRRLRKSRKRSTRRRV
jgi:hypothetical protein